MADDQIEQAGGEVTRAKEEIDCSFERGDADLPLCQGALVLAESTETLAQGVVGLRDEVSQYRKRSRTDRVLIGLLALIIVVLGGFSYIEWKADKEITSLAQDGIACLVEQNFEHRYAQSSAHRADADHHGYEYDKTPVKPPTAEEVLALQRQLLEKCARFIQDRRVQNGGG